MREFFETTLLQLRALTGSRQMEFLSEEETKMILDKLCQVSRQFSRIPEEKQMAEVDKQIIEDQEFTGLNPKIFYKWMYRIAGQFPLITENELMPRPNESILEGEQRDYWLSKWRESLNQMQSNLTQAGKGGGSRLKESLGIEKAQSVGVIKNYDIRQTCPACKGQAQWFNGGDPPDIEYCEKCLGIGQINIVSIPATSEEEARKQYTELFGS